MDELVARATKDPGAVYGVFKALMSMHVGAGNGWETCPMEMYYRNPVESVIRALQADKNRVGGISKQNMSVTTMLDDAIDKLRIILHNQCPYVDTIRSIIYALGTHVWALTDVSPDYFSQVDKDAEDIKIALSERRLYIIANNVLQERDFLMIAHYPIFFVSLVMHTTIFFDGEKGDAIDFFAHDFGHATLYYTYQNDHSDAHRKKYSIALTNFYETPLTPRKEQLEKFLFFAVHENRVSLERFLSDHLHDSMFTMILIRLACQMLLFNDDFARREDVYTIVTDCLSLFGHGIGFDYETSMRIIDRAILKFSKEYTKRKRLIIIEASKIPDNEDTLKILARMEAISI